MSISSPMTKNPAVLKDGDADVENPERVLKNLSFGGEITISSRYLDAYIAFEQIREILAMHTLSVTRCVRRGIMLRGSKRSFKLGVIGCGQVGSHCIDKILSSGIAPSSILVSTRRPEEGHAKSLVEKWGKALVIHRDNESVGLAARLLLIACTPAQLGNVSASLRGKLRPGTLVCSVVAGFSAKKIQIMLQTKSAVLKIGIGMGASRIGARFAGAETLAEKATIAADQIGPSFAAIEDLTGKVVSLLHEIRPIVPDHDIESLEDEDLKARLLKDAEEQAMASSRQAGMLAVLGNTGVSLKGQAHEESETVARFRASYVDSVL